MDSPLRIGIAGCGRIAQVSHAPSLAAIDDVCIAAIHDTDRAKAEALREAHAPEAQACTSYEELLAAKLDAVCICTPNHLHCDMALKAFDAGLHVLCEKPMAGSLIDADHMLRAARASGLILHINQSLRYAPLYVTIKKLIELGRIGDVQHVRCIRASGKMPNQGWSPGADWFVSQAHQGGLLLDIGIHMADLLRWHVGGIRRVAGFLQTRTPGIDVPDNVRAMFDFESGATGTLELSWTFPAGGGLFEVYGTKGSIRSGFNGQQLELVEIGEDETSTESHPPLDNVPANSFQNFVDAIRGRAESLSPGEVGREALAICMAIAESSQSGAYAAVHQLP